MCPVFEFDNRISCVASELAILRLYFNYTKATGVNPQGENHLKKYTVDKLSDGKFMFTTDLSISFDNK